MVIAKDDKDLNYGLNYTTDEHLLAFHDNELLKKKEPKDEL